MLRLEGLSRRVADRQLLDGVDLTVEDGEIVAVLGPTGTGKTTLLRLIMGLDVPDGGAISWDDERLAVAGKNLRVPQERGFSLVFQDPILLPFASVADNVHLGVSHRDGQVRRRAEQLYELLGLEHLVRRAAWKLSGGEQQRVAMARSLMVRPRLLLLDEPFSNLDRPFKHRLYPRLGRFLAAEGTTTIVVTHDRQGAFFLSHRICVLGGGKLSRCEPPEALYRQPPDADAAALLGACNTLTPAEAAALFDLSPTGADTDQLLVRPEQLRLEASEPHHGTLTESRFHGFFRVYELQVDDGPSLTVLSPVEPELEVGGRYRLRLAEGAGPVWLPGP